MKLIREEEEGISRDKRRELTQRATVDPRFSHDVTTPSLEVVSRTTDPMVWQGDAGSRWQKLAQSLGVLGDQVPLIGQAMQTGYKREYEAGALDALQGTEKPSKGQARIQGYETFKGEDTAKRDYKLEVRQYFEDNHQVLTPEEFEDGLHEIAQKYVLGSTNNFLKGFLPYASQIEQKIYEDYANYQSELYRNQSFSLVNNKAHDDTVELLENVLGEHFGIRTLDELIERSDVYSQFVSGDYGSHFAPILRQSLSDAQAEAENMGLGKKEVSRIYIDRIGQIAVKYGLPELLDFAYEKDIHGISLARKPEGLSSDKYKDSAEDVQKRRAEAFSKYLSEEAKIELEDNQQTLRLTVEEVLAKGTPKEALDLYENLVKNPAFRRMTGGETSTIARRLLEHSLKTGPEDSPFAEKDNPFVLDYFALPRRTGGLVKEEIEKAKSSLTYEAYSTLLDDFFKQELKKIQAQTELDLEALKETERLQAQDAEALLKETTLSISDLETVTDPVERVGQARELREQFLSDPRLPYVSEAKLKEKLSELTRFATEDLEFDSKGNMYLFTELRDRARLGEIDWEEVYNIQASRTHRGQPIETNLSESQFSVIADILTQNEVQARADQAKKIEEDRKKSEKKQEEIENAQRKKEDEAKKLAKTNSMNETVDLLLEAGNLTDPVEILMATESIMEKIREDAETHQYLTEERSKYLFMAEEIRKNAGKFPDEGDMGVYTELSFKAVRNELTSEDVARALANRDLSQANFNHLTNELSRIQREQEEGTLDKWNDKDIITKMENQYIDTVVERTDYYSITPEGLTKETALKRRLTGALVKFRNENEGRNPSYEEWQDYAFTIFGDYITLEELLGDHAEVSRVGIVTETKEGTKTAKEFIPMDEIDPEVMRERSQEALNEKSKGLFSRLRNLYGREIPQTTDWAFAKEESLDIFMYNMVELGLSINEIREGYRGLGFSEEAVKFYIHHATVEYATEWFRELGTAIESRRNLEKYLKDNGFSHDETLSIINKAQDRL